MKIRHAGFFVAALGCAIPLYAANMMTGDTGAEANADAFTSGVLSANVIRGVIDSTTAAEGKSSVRLEYDGKIYAAIRPSSHWLVKRVAFAETPELADAEDYTVSFFAKAKSGNYKINLTATPARQGWDFSPYTTQKTLILSTEWKRYSLTFRPKTLKSTKIRTYSIGLAFLSAGTVWIDALQLEKGTAPTEYNAPETASVGAAAVNPPHRNIWLEGEPIKVKFKTVLRQKFSNAMLKASAVDWCGRTVRKFERSIPDDGVIEYDFSNLPFGWFKIQADIAAGGKTLASHFIHLVKVKKPVKLENGVIPFTGGIGSTSDPRDGETASRLGVKRMQLDVLWYEIEPSPGAYEWKMLDTRMELALKSGLRVKALIEPMHCPRWARDANDVGNPYPLPMRRYKEAYLNMIRKFLERYGKTIDTLELSGEINGTVGGNSVYRKKYPEFLETDSNGQKWVTRGPAFEWISELVESAAIVAKKTAPCVKLAVMRPSQGRPGEPWLFVRRFMEKMEKYSDVFSTDTYLYSPFQFGPEITTVRRPNTVDDREITMGYIREMTGKPAFISESGISLDHRESGISKNEIFRAETIVKDFMVSRAAGFYAYDWFMLFSNTRDPFPYDKFFLVYDDRPESGAAALSAVASHVENTSGGKYLKLNAYVRAAVLRKLDGRGIAAVWSDSPGELKIAGPFRYSDMMGNPIPLKNGELALESAPVWIESEKYDILSDALKKAPCRMTRFCDVFFIRTGEKTGSLRFHNIDEKAPLVLNVKFEGAEQTSTVRIGHGGVNTFFFPLVSEKTAVKGSFTDEWEGGRTASFKFEIPELTAIPAGEPALIAKTGAMSDIAQAEMMPPWTGPDDLSMFLYASWNTDALRLKAVVKDDIHCHNTKLSGWEADSFHFAVNPLNDGIYAKETQFGKRGASDLECAVYLDDSGKVRCDTYYGKHKLSTGEFSVKRDKFKKTTTYEVHISWSKLGVKPRKGMVFGMSFVVPDDDVGHGREYDAFVGGGILYGKDASKYKYFVLK